jgi:fumarate hydratase subunit beta
MVKFENLRVKEKILFSGTVFTARDQAHRRLVKALKRGERLPFDLKGAVIYYCAPTRTPKGRVIGSCGPTTSSRMDEFTPALLKAGVAGMIGKGARSKKVIAAIKKYKAVYLLAYAGCGALISRYVKKATLVAYPDLGPERILKLEVKDFPLIVGIDARGRSIYG